jgi:[ribosomal protein S5]-alanine N-acetyltransferase
MTAEYIPERIVGPRLVLRLPVIDDAVKLYEEIGRDPEVTKYLLWTPHPDLAATRRVIAERMNVDPRVRTWVMVLQHSGEIAGMISCARAMPYAAEVGYSLGRRWWGQGLMSDALDMVMTMLRADPVVYRVWATCHVDNERSVRLLERAGLTLEGRMARHTIFPNLGPEPVDSLLYGKALR